MNLKELLGDPAWLFDLGFQIQPISDGKLFANPERLEWELEDQHRIPPFGSLSDEKRFAEVSLAWSERGFFMHAVVPQPKTAKPLSGASAKSTLISLYVDTRWSPDVHRGTTYCHRFELICVHPTSSQIQRGHGELNAMQRARAMPNPVHPKDLAVGALKRDFGFEIKAFLPSDTLTGFDPLEFQEIGVFYVINDGVLGNQFMARSRFSPYFEDPSLWCRGKLIQPITSAL